jgi:hypothetical protein
LSLVAMCCVVFHSFCFISAVSGRRCILVIRYVNTAVLCPKGWLDSKLIVVSAVVDFLYISVSRCGVFGLCSVPERLCFRFLLVSV